LADNFDEQLQLDLAASTRRAYGWHQEDFIVLLKKLGLPLLPTERASALFVLLGQRRTMPNPP
jgi:hypothetical protein